MQRLIILFIALFIVQPSFAHDDVDYTNLGKTIVYVCDTNTCGQTPGVGSSWSNALDDLPSSLTRDYVYMVAGGDYSGYTFDDATSDDNYIYIVKATEDDHGTGDGWNDAYDDDPATFPSIMFYNSGYFTLDGQTGGGPNSWTTGHGFVFTEVWDEGEASEEHMVDFEGTNSHINIYHANLYPTPSHAGYGHLFWDSSGDETTYINISHCYGHHNRGCFFLTRSVSNWTVEYSYFEHNWSIVKHAEPWADSGSDYIIFRWNVIKNGHGSSHFNGVLTQGNMDYWEIYGNVFYHTGDADPSIVVHGLLRTPQDASNTVYGRYWKIYNNTLYGWYDNNMAGGMYFYTGDSTGNVAYNNITMDCEGGAATMTMSDPPYLTHDYNTYVSQPSPPSETNGTITNDDPFTNSTNFDLTLSAAMAGNALDTEEYDNRDMFGNIRGADGVWDRGAYEYDESPSLTPTISGCTFK